MKKGILLYIVMTFIFIGCSQDEFNNNPDENNSTKTRVYSKKWDGDPLIVKQIINDPDYVIINEITDPDIVEELTNALKNADWLEDIDTDIELEGTYSFIWNSFEHRFWLDKEDKIVVIMISGQSNLGYLTKKSSKVVFEILTGKKNNTLNN